MEGSQDSKVEGDLTPHPPGECLGVNSWAESSFLHLGPSWHVPLWVIIFFFFSNSLQLMMDLQPWSACWGCCLLITYQPPTNSFTLVSACASPSCCKAYILTFSIIFCLNLFVVLLSSSSCLEVGIVARTQDRWHKVGWQERKLHVWDSPRRARPGHLVPSLAERVPRNQSGVGNPQ